VDPDPDPLLLRKNLTVLFIDILFIPSTEYAQEKLLEVSNINEIEGYQKNLL
jgi:hypothetical protein